MILLKKEVFDKDNNPGNVEQKSNEKVFNRLTAEEVEQAVSSYFDTDYHLSDMDVNVFDADNMRIWFNLWKDDNSVENEELWPDIIFPPFTSIEQVFEFSTDLFKSYYRETLLDD